MWSLTRATVLIVLRLFCSNCPSCTHRQLFVAACIVYKKEPITIFFKLVSTQMLLIVAYYNK